VEDAAHEVALSLGHDHDHGGIALRLRGLGGVDSCDFPGLVAAFGGHLGLDAQALRKAARPVGGKEPDARYPGLRKLIAQARRDWQSFGDELVEKVMELAREGRLLPLTAANEARLADLFTEHEVGVLLRVSGRGDPTHLAQLRAAGILGPDGPQVSYIEAAWRIGRAIDPHGLDSGMVQDPSATLSDVLRPLVEVPLSPTDKASLDYVQRRGFVFMRRPLQGTSDDVYRALVHEEYSKLRGAMDASVTLNEGWQDTARRLKDTVRGNASLGNDWDRVAKTELAFAHNHGALERLRDESLTLTGSADPKVYKLVSASACSDCRRIWGPNDAPKKYSLSFVETRNGGNGNFGLRRQQWGPCVGPIHPNCTEGPLHLWNPKVHDVVQRIAERMRNGS